MTDFNQGFNDINTNFIVTSQGIFEGLGWDIKFERTIGINSESLRISIFGNGGFSSAQQERMIKLLIEDGKIIGKVSLVSSVFCENFRWFYCSEEPTEASTDETEFTTDFQTRQPITDPIMTTEAPVSTTGFP